MTPRTCGGRALAWGALLAVLLTGLTEARAATGASDKAAADALYDQAKRLMASGNFDAACPKLAESQRLDPGVGTLLTLGECYDRTGKKASAWSTFREAAALANTRGQRAREKIARKRAASVEPQLSMLRIDVPVASDVAGLAVLRDDEPVGKPLWGTPVPVDPGEHTVVASAAGRKPWTTKVRVERPKQLATVSIPLLPSDEVPKPPPHRAPVKDEGAGRGGPQRVIGFAAGGLGLGGIGAGIGLGVYASAKHEDAQAHCSPTCKMGGGDVIQAEAKRIALGSTIAFVAGGTLLAGGVILVLTAPSAKAPSAALGVAPLVSRDLRGAVISGAF